MDDKLKKFTENRKPGDTNFFSFEGKGFWELKQWFDAPCVSLVEKNTGEKKTFSVNAPIAESFVFGASTLKECDSDQLLMEEAKRAARRDVRRLSPEEQVALYKQIRTIYPGKIVILI